jgi:hypothetical protein
MQPDTMADPSCRGDRFVPAPLQHPQVLGQGGGRGQGGGPLGELGGLLGLLAHPYHLPTFVTAS